MGVWKQIAALPNPRYDAAAVFHGGKVYVLGGQATEAGGYLNTNYIYDPAGNTWSAGAPLPGSNLCFAFSTASDGVHVVFPTDGTHFAYDPATNTWATRTSAPAPARTTAHYFTDAAGRFYLAGGQPIGGSTTVTNKVNRYDPATNSWTARADMPSVASHLPVNAPGALGSDGKVYLGSDRLPGFLVYNPVADAWATTPDMPDAPNNRGVRAAPLPSGIVLALPHLHLRGLTSEPLRRVDGYDPAAGTWAMGVTPDFPGNSYGTMVATEPGGIVYLVGGHAFIAGDNTPPTSAGWAWKQNDAPTAPTQRTLIGGVLVSTGGANRAAWTFNDPNVGDSQSQYEVRYKLTADTTWTTVTKGTPNPWHDFAAGSLAPGDYEWQVKVWDAGGLESPRTASAFFTAADPPAGPSITYPINGQTVGQAETVVWSAPAQDSYELRRVADASGTPNTSTVYFDTGEVAESLTRLLAVQFPTNLRNEHVQVRVKSGGLWSVWTSVMVQVSYTPPPTPTFTVYPDASTGSLLLMIANPAPTGSVPAAAYNDVYVDDGDGEERKATALATNTGWRYWTPKSGRDYLDAIRVVAVAANGVTASS